MSSIDIGINDSDAEIDIKKLALHVFQNIAHFVFVLDEQLNIVYYSTKVLDLFETKRKRKILGKNFFAVHKAFQANSKKIEKVFEYTFEGNNSSFVVTIPLKKEIINMEFFTSVYEMKNKKKYIIVVGSDKTRAIDTNRYLTSLSKTLLIINQMLRHDLNNRLSAIQGIIELYQELRDEELLLKALKNVQQATEIISRATDIEQKATSPTKSQLVNICEIFGNLINSYASIDIVISCKEEYLVYADHMLTNVFENLIENAINHGKATLIEIKIREKNATTLAIEVSDNGTGIPPEFKEKLFEEELLKGKTAGHGLGLFISKRIIERYGGNIYHTDPGDKKQGAKFVLEIPFMPKNDETV